jgi:hypothetical protein
MEAAALLSLLRSAWAALRSRCRRSEQVDNVAPELKRQLNHRLDAQVLRAALDSLHVAWQHVEPLGQHFLRPAAPGPDLGDTATDALEQRGCLGEHSQRLRTAGACKHSRIGVCFWSYRGMHTANGLALCARLLAAASSGRGNRFHFAATRQKDATLAGCGR